MLVADSKVDIDAVSSLSLNFPFFVRLWISKVLPLLPSPTTIILT